VKVDTVRKYESLWNDYPEILVKVRINGKSRYRRRVYMNLGWFI